MATRLAPLRLRSPSATQQTARGRSRAEQVTGNPWIFSGPTLPTPGVPAFQGEPTEVFAGLRSGRIGAKMPFEIPIHEIPIHLKFLYTRAGSPFLLSPILINKSVCVDCGVIIDSQFIADDLYKLKRFFERLPTFIHI